MIGRFLLGARLVLVMIFGGPLAAGCMAGQVGEDYALWGLAVPFFAALIYWAIS